MRNEPDRAIFTVKKHQEGWAVESNGAVLDRHSGKDEAKAAAHKRARASQDAGRACMVRVSGEHGFFAAD